MRELTAFQRDLLYVVAANDGEHGQTLSDALEAYDYDKVLHGRLYPALRELAERGLIEQFEIDGRTTGNRLTDHGRRAIEERRVWEAEQLEAYAQGGDGDA